MAAGVVGCAAVNAIAWCVKGLLMASYKCAVVDHAIAALVAVLKAAPANVVRAPPSVSLLPAAALAAGPVTAAPTSPAPAEQASPVPWAAARAFQTMLSDDTVLSRACGATVNVSAQTSPCFLGLCLDGCVST